MRFTANMRELERELKRLNSINSRATRDMADAHARAARQSEMAWRNSNLGRVLTDQISSVGPAVKAMAATIATAFAGNEALQAAERWTTFGNSLRVAGLEGGNLRSVQEQLYQAAIKNGVELQPLGQLYGRLAASANELGASQSQLIQFTNGITSALRVQGGPAEAASGALLQLSQAMGAGIVRAEEWNSINEGAKPILDAVAAGWAKQGTTVAKLRATMLEGKLSSAEFFEAFLRGSSMLEEKAAKAPLTVAQGMTNLHTALTRYIGQTNEAYGVTERIGQAIKWLAENLDTVKTSILVVGGVYAATLTPAIGMAGKALGGLIATQVAAGVSAIRLASFNVAMTASMTGMSTAAAAGSVALTGLKGAMAWFGGPVGLAFLAISSAIAYIGYSSATAALETTKLDRSIAEYTKRREEAAAAENKAQIETGNLDAKQRAALESTANLTGQVNLLASTYGRLALEAKRARLEILAGDVVRTGQAWLEKRRARESAEETARISGPAAIPNPDGGFDFTGLAGQKKRQDRIVRESPAVVQARKEEAEARANFEFAREERRKGRAQDAMDFAPPKPIAPPAKAEKPKKTKDNSSSSERAEEAAEKAYHQALHASAKTAEERHKYALEALEEDKADKLDQLERQVHDKQITRAAADAAKSSYEKAHLLQVESENYRRQQELAEETQRQNEAGNNLSNEKLRLEADAIEAMAEVETDLRKKHAYERDALRKRQDADDAAFKQEQDQLELDRRKAGWTEEVIRRLREQAQSNRDAEKRIENTKIDNDQKGDGNGSIRSRILDEANGFGTLNEQLANITNGGIDNLTRGLADAAMGAKSLKEAFSDMSKSVIGQLIEMGIRFAIFEALGMALGVKGLGKAAVGLGSVKKNAMGTDSFSGGLSLVGEAGPELVSMPRGSQVVPNNLLRQAFSNGISGGGSTSNTTVINNNINANNAVLTDWISQEINKGMVQATQASMKLSQQNMQKQQKTSLIRR